MCVLPHLTNSPSSVCNSSPFEVSDGSVIRVDPEASRTWWNTGHEDLYYLVIQARKDSMNTSTGEDGELVEGDVPWK